MTKFLSLYIYKVKFYKFHHTINPDSSNIFNHKLTKLYLSNTIDTIMQISLQYKKAKTICVENYKVPLEAMFVSWGDLWQSV